MSDAASFETVTDIEVMPEFYAFIPSAILRLKYIIPDVEIRATASGIRVIGQSDLSDGKLRQEVNYQIYREKIFQETINLRQSLYKMLAM